ncbi:MAG TPA: CARDB domain-containing protein [Methanothermobacter sp.]|nr:conserved hypothetical protein [Methanothermobacter sp. MT-2]HHW04719.1 hypothetical protein [Methanothermobacter sp.]HOK72804.1 CARDB domain-containing protein [Methanothermobacter sp.]HOL69658.1 CARDB domain-containing protein [Methanothermobacter sp.]HPQ05270.1 CARDB domain-containing protein [Methanothermobacter sp.]
MKIGTLTILIVGLLAVVAAAYLLTKEPGTPTLSNTTQKTESNVTSTGAAKLVATQEGPETAHPGTNVTITCEIKNVGSEPAENIIVTSQVFEKRIEKINPGEKVKFNISVYIPTLEEVKKDFGPNATLSNPFYIGGYTVIYHDIKGEHQITSNPINIKLI